MLNTFVYTVTMMRKFEKSVLYLILFLQVFHQNEILDGFSMKMSKFKTI